MNCPECDANMSIPDDAAVGEIISCGECGADFEIAKKEGSNIESVSYTHLTLPTKA